MPPWFKKNNENTYLPECLTILAFKNSNDHVLLLREFHMDIVFEASVNKVTIMQNFDF